MREVGPGIEHGRRGDGDRRRGEERVLPPSAEDRQRAPEGERNDGERDRLRRATERDAYPRRARGPDDPRDDERREDGHRQHRASAGAGRAEERCGPDGRRQRRRPGEREHVDSRHPRAHEEHLAREPLRPEREKRSHVGGGGDAHEPCAERHEMPRGPLGRSTARDAERRERQHRGSKHPGRGREARRHDERHRTDREQCQHRTADHAGTPGENEYRG